MGASLECCSSRNGSKDQEDGDAETKGPPAEDAKQPCSAKQRGSISSMWNAMPVPEAADKGVPSEQPFESDEEDVNKRGSMSSMWNSLLSPMPAKNHKSSSNPQPEVEAPRNTNTRSSLSSMWASLNAHSEASIEKGKKTDSDTAAT
eukprot:TRINITY_DN97537_c0_g1_i1.p1 TRINITY_DN97537_c0_g1~~TRINITY_DN97537_c0_g1_i1.p1  ORF type:complete len:147 (+),score=30.33 TRINITY_DN97537_c0_g1_i1:55-495(+)